MSASKNLAGSIARYQAGKKLTDAELCAEIGISTSTYYRMKKGDEGFHSATLDRISEVTGLSPSALLSEPDRGGQLSASVTQTIESFSALSQSEYQQAQYHYGKTLSWARIGARRRWGWLGDTP